jgi:acyl-CoA reductase-like NAD-dependent aldehyde dehydrogenase
MEMGWIGVDLESTQSAIVDRLTRSGVLVPFIGGQRVADRSGDTFEAINPATEELLTTVVRCDQQHLDEAVASAHDAQLEWVRMAASRRSELLWRWGDLLTRDADAIGTLETLEIGKPIRTSRPEAKRLCRTAQYWAGMADKILGTQMPIAPGSLTYTTRTPAGVVGSITPWNGPASSAVSRISSALACGNGIVLKPSEWSSFSAGYVAELTVEAGIPPGLVNVVTGDGVIGSAVASHPGIGAVRFTGSVATGRRVALAAAPTFKQVTLEMGGKSPNIVFDDAAMDAALRGTVWGVFHNSGQVCCAGTRLLVQETVAEEFIQRLVALSGNLRTGDPLDVANHLGTVASRQQCDRVQDYIASGVSQGAEVAIGGGRPPTVGPQGYFIAPTVFTKAERGMKIAQEEIFGPVLTALTFKDEEHALEIANDVDYGLASCVWTQDVSRMLRMADRLDTGSVWGNTARLMDPGLPFGGFKDSGLGNSRGEGAIMGSTKTKAVTIHFDPSMATPGWDDL